MKKTQSTVVLRGVIIETYIADRSTGLLATKPHSREVYRIAGYQTTYSRQVYIISGYQNRLVDSLVLSFMKRIKLTHIDEVGRLLSIPGLERRRFASDVDTGMLAVDLSISTRYLDFKTK
jgi:hypothetical protein